MECRTKFATGAQLAINEAIHVSLREYGATDWSDENQEKHTWNFFVKTYELIVELRRQGVKHFRICDIVHGNMQGKLPDTFQVGNCPYWQVNRFLDFSRDEQTLMHQVLDNCWIRKIENAGARGNMSAMERMTGQKMLPDGYADIMYEIRSYNGIPMGKTPLRLMARDVPQQYNEYAKKYKKKYRA